MIYSFLLAIAVLGLSILISLPLGKWMFKMMCPAPDLMGPAHRKVEGFFHKVIGRAAEADQNWKQYTVSLLIFNTVMFVVVTGVLAFQQFLPLNPDGQKAIEGSLIFNTVTSFVTNTNLQHYSGESTLSYFSQLFGIMWLQFVSAATGLAAVTAASRWLGGSRERNNFYLDMCRATFLVILPVAAIGATLLVLCGLPMTFDGAAVVHTLEGAVQTIARGPVAVEVIIKQLGTNGGGFFGPNSTHPLENVGFYSNIIECISLVIIPMGCVWMFGMITKHRKHALVIFAVMTVLCLVKLGCAITFESEPAVALHDLPVAEASNLEGKELRLGAGASPLWAVFTTCTSNGSVNSMHCSLNPLTGLIPLVGMWFNITFGGIGVGFLGLFTYIIIGVFICGMMVGRTPEYLGKKVETREMKYALPALLMHPLCILGGMAIFCLIPAWGRDTVLNPGFHGVTEMLYEFTSSSANNGSGFEGLGDNTVPWNIACGLVMLIGRFIPIIFQLAICGSLFAKKEVPETVGTLKTDTALFGVVIGGTVVFVGALLFLPVAVLGPIAEYLTTLVH